MKRTLVLSLLLVGTACAEEWRLDAGHSKIAFTAEARFFSAEGQFRKFDVKADVDEKALENSKVTVTVDAASIDTNNERRDNHLRSKDFFEVATHPTSIIEIKAIRKLAENNYEADGQVTIHGVTKPVKLPVKVVLFENGRLRFRGNIDLNRKEFGISYNSRMNPVEDVVAVRYEVSLIKPKPPGPPSAPAPAQKN